MPSNLAGNPGDLLRSTNPRDRTLRDFGCVATFNRTSPIAADRRDFKNNMSSNRAPTPMMAGKCGQLSTLCTTLPPS
jgi:hypothetical protein